MMETTTTEDGYGKRMRAAAEASTHKHMTGQDQKRCDAAQADYDEAGRMAVLWKYQHAAQQKAEGQTAEDHKSLCQSLSAAWVKAAKKTAETQTRRKEEEIQRFLERHRAILMEIQGIAGMEVIEAEEALIASLESKLSGGEIQVVEEPEGRITFEGIPMPWYGRSTNWTIVAVATFVLSVLFLILTGNVLKAVALGFTCAISGYNIISIAVWYNDEDDESTFTKGKNYIIPFILMFMVLVFAHSENTKHQFSLLISMVLLSLYWFGWNHWIIKMEVLVELMIIGLIVLWSPEVVHSHVARYEDQINADLAFNAGNAFLKAEAFILGVMHNITHVVLELQLYWVGILYILVQRIFFHKYVEGRDFSMNI